MFSAADHFMNQRLYSVSWMLATWLTFPSPFGLLSGGSKVSINNRFVEERKRIHCPVVVDGGTSLNPCDGRADIIRWQINSCELAKHRRTRIFMVFYGSKIFNVQVYSSKKKDSNARLRLKTSRVGIWNFETNNAPTGITLNIQDLQALWYSTF